MNQDSASQGQVVGLWPSVLGNREVGIPLGFLGQRWVSIGEGQCLMAQADSVPCASQPLGPLMVAYACKWLISRVM